MFIDEVVISVKAGNGGNGCLAFRREKFVPRGGPSGGDGGRGGDVVLVASTHHNTLLHFRYNPEHSAERGRHGEGSNRTGRDGHSIELPVPVGTVVYNAESGEQICDLAEVGQRFTVAAGGGEDVATRVLRRRPIKPRRNTKRVNPAMPFVCVLN